MIYKKILYATLTMLLSAVTATMSQAAAQAKGAVLVEDNFSASPMGVAPKGWGVSKYGGGEAVVTDKVTLRAVDPADVGRSVEFTRKTEASGAAMRRYFKLPRNAAHVIISSWASTENKNGVFYPVIIGEWCAKLGFGRNQKLFYSQKASDGKEQLKNFDGYVPAQWYHFKVDVNLDKDTYDFWLDDKPVAQNIPLVKPAKGFNSVMVSTGGGTGGEAVQKSYLANIQVTAIGGEGAAATEPVRHFSSDLTVHSFGQPIVYGHAESRLKDVFPIGVEFIVGRYMTNAKWRWYVGYGRARSTGRLDAMGRDMRYRDLSIPVPGKGKYMVSFRLADTRLTGVPPETMALDVKRQGDGAFDRITWRNDRADPGVWVEWKEVDLDGHPLVIRHPHGYMSGLSGVRFTPASEGEKTATFAGDAFVDLIRSANSIYEQDNPADVAAYLDEMFPVLKKLNVEVVSLNAPSVAAARMYLEKAKEYGLKAILLINAQYLPVQKEAQKLSAEDPQKAEAVVEEQLRPFVEAIKDQPALLAYRMNDEPFVEEIGGYRALHQALAKLDPVHPGISLMCRDGWNGGNRRGPDNMKKIVDGVGEDVLYNDLYPIRNPPEESLKFLDRFAWCLEDDQRQAGGRPLWIMGQTYHYRQELRDPTPAEIRVQAYLSIAHGATGMMYYQYNGDAPSLFDADGNPNASHAELGKVLGELRQLGPLLLTLQRVKMDADVPGDIDLQGFVGKDGARYLIAVNKDVNGARQLDVRLPAADAGKILDMRSGQSVSSEHRGDWIEFRLKIAPGDGRVLKL
jgi:hypothetical protein